MLPAANPLRTAEVWRLSMWRQADLVKSSAVIRIRNASLCIGQLKVIVHVYCMYGPFPPSSSRGTVAKTIKDEPQAVLSALITVSTAR